MKVKTAAIVTSERSRMRALGLGKHLWVVAFLFIFMVLIPATMGQSYYVHVFNLVGLFAIVVIGLDLLIGYGGQLSFGHHGFFALGAYATGMLTVKLGWPIWLSFLLSVPITCLVALVIGLPTLRLRGYYLAIATMAFGWIVVGLTIPFTEITGGYSGLGPIPRIHLGPLALDSDVKFYFLVWAVVFLVMVASLNMVNSRMGRAVRAIASDEAAAEAAGINLAKYKTQVFVVTAGYAALAGSLYGQYLRVVLPNHFELGTLMELILMLFLGGQQSIWGALIGATVLKFLPEFAGVFQDYKVIIYGLLFVGIIFLLPMGLAGAIGALLSRLRVPGQRLAFQAPQGVRVEPYPPIEAEADPNKPGPNGSAMLEVCNLRKSFGGLMAVADVSFQVRGGQLKGLIGPNGAGKTTTFNLICGVYPPTRGEVRFEGASTTGRKPHVVASMGIARTFQPPRLFGNMTVLGNVMVGHHIRGKSGLLGAALPWGPVRLEEERFLQNALYWLKFAGLEEKAYHPARSLPFGEWRLLEICRALASEPRLLLLDEPAAGLNDLERDRLSELLLRIQERGITILLVEHSMDLVMKVCQEIVVLDHGEKIAEGPPAEIRRNERVIAAYLGQE